MSEDVRNRIAATGSKIGELGGVGLHAIAQLSSGAKTPDDFKLRHSAS